ncbi:hypothetical protein VPG91_11610 [Nitrospirillum amazonense]|uniref:hypothetical protein n=1 Tax=Nitrospirillum amazonense TaxID=28077 RepID=UPI002DD421A9|nr:hypothetical protein [Nitrospirillum amazonense]MEC4591636.1 hypothetical protein [Nitrospirillum amazonense]
MSDVDRNLDLALENTAAETLTGDFRDAILDRMRQLQKPWSQLGEFEQRELNNGVQAAAEAMVRKAVQLIAAQGRICVVGKLEQITIKDGFKLVVTVPETICGSVQPHRLEMIDSTHKEVLVVVADPAAFTGERAPAEVDAEQPGLPLVEGDDDDRPIADSMSALAPERGQDVPGRRRRA